MSPFFSNMKEIIIQNKAIDFLTPQVITPFTGEWLNFGADNQAPQMFSLLGRTVSNHRALLNSKVRYTSGSRIDGLEGAINNEGSDLKTIVSRLMYDEFSTGNTFIDIVTDSRKSFLQLYHVDSTKGRIGKDLDRVFFHPTWKNVTLHSPDIIERPIYPNFVEEDGLMRSVIWKKQYEPEFINGIPTWYAGLRTAVISGLVDESNKSDLENSHAISGMLFIPNVSDTEAKELSDKIQAEDTGAENHGKLKIGYYNGDTGIKPELIDFRKEVEGNYVNLKDVTNNQLVMIHSWYRSLAGYQDATGFDTNRINDEYKVALSSSILPKQAEYTKVLNGLLGDFKYGEIEFINESPTEEISDNDLMTVWEMRESRGMSFDKLDPAQQILIYQLKK